MEPVSERRSAREHLLAEHDHLRRLMNRVAATAFEVVLDEKRRPSLRDALAELRLELEAHLEYEVTTLVPLLVRADRRGPDRADHLLKDHAGQRALLLALTEQNVVSSSVAKDVFEKMWATGDSARAIIDREGLAQNADVSGEKSEPAE